MEIASPSIRRSIDGLAGGSPWMSLSRRPGAIRSVFERDRKLLEYLHELGVRPGAKVEVIARNYDDTITFGSAE